MARLVITPSTYVNNYNYPCSFTALNTSQQGWYLAPGNYGQVVLIGWSTEDHDVAITISAGTSEQTTSYQGQDFIYKQKGDLSTDIGTSEVCVLFLDTNRFKSTSGIYIDCATSGATAVHWAAIYTKPTL